MAETRNAGNQVVVVVSAMGDTTDDLLDLANEVARKPPARELDMLLTAGFTPAERNGAPGAAARAGQAPSTRSR